MYPWLLPRCFVCSKWGHQRYSCLLKGCARSESHQEDQGKNNNVASVQVQVETVGESSVQAGAIVFGASSGVSAMEKERKATVHAEVSVVGIGSAIRVASHTQKQKVLESMVGSETEKLSAAKDDAVVVLQAVDNNLPPKVTEGDEENGEGWTFSPLRPGRWLENLEKRCKRSTSFSISFCSLS